MIRANELLDLPHSVHLHCNNLGVPGNYQTTLETIDLAPDLNSRRQSLYLTMSSSTPMAGRPGAISVRSQRISPGP